MVAVCAHDIEVLQDNVVAIAEHHRHDVYSVFAICGVVCYVGVSGVCVTHSYCPGTDNLYPVLVSCVKHRLVHKVAVCPRNARYNHVMAV